MTILFVMAHPDDEAYGPAGTIKKLSKDNKVVVLCLCKGNKPGKEHVSNARGSAFFESCKKLGAIPVIKDSSDLYLDYHQALRDIEEVMQEHRPDTIYTHNNSDVHLDHQTVHKAVLAASRPCPSSYVNALYNFELPGSTEWAFHNNQFVPSVFVDVTDVMQEKKDVLNLYFTELRDSPDPRSLQGMINLAQYRGQQVGFHFAEAFQLVFSRRQKI